MAPGPKAATVLIRPTRGRVLLAASWAYAGLVMLVLILLRWVGDGWWGVTPLLLMPRWLFFGPLVVLAVASGMRRCPWHWVLQGATGVIVAGPLMGLSLPFAALAESAPVGERIRLATFNIGPDPIRVGAIKQWADRLKIDVICFQEGERNEPSLGPFEAAGWHVSRGKHVASRFPIVDEMPQFEGKWDTELRYSAMLERVRVRTPSGHEFVVASVHLPTLRTGLVRLLSAGDTAGLQLHSAWWGRETARVLASLAETNDQPMLIAGDFNMPSDDSTMAALRVRFQFAFEQVGWGYGYTRPARLPWVRIDHILAGPEWALTRCRVGPNFGSDHLPLWCEAVLQAPSAPPTARAAAP